MSLTKVTRNFQVTIPAQIRKMLHIRVGSIVDFTVKGATVILKPKAMIDEDQTWFWTKEWQEGEAQVNEALKKKETLSFGNVEQMRKHLEPKKNRPHKTV